MLLWIYGWMAFLRLFVLYLPVPSESCEYKMISQERLDRLTDTSLESFQTIHYPCHFGHYSIRMKKHCMSPSYRHDLDENRNDQDCFDMSDTLGST